MSINDVWTVHGNWIGSGKHAVHVKNDNGKLISKYFSSANAAKRYAISKAKSAGMKKYGAETSSGRWVDRRVNKTIRRKVRRQSNPFAMNTFKVPSIRGFRF